MEECTIMVKLTQILEQYPWNPQAPEDWSDKEIYTHTVDPEDASKVWKVPIFPCMKDFAYLGYRIRANVQLFPESVRLMTGDGKRHNIFGEHTDKLKDGFETVNWTRFKYPLPYRLLCLDEDEMCLEIKFRDEVFGKVEFLGQQFEELEDQDRPLWFCENDFVDKGKILSPNQYFYTMDTLVKRADYPNALSIYKISSYPK